jgi:hypothetical protein
MEGGEVTRSIRDDRCVHFNRNTWGPKCRGKISERILKKQDVRV